MRTYLMKPLVAGALLCTLTGCWDRIEINELAVAGLVGSETDKDTKEQIVYYQIVNPGSVSADSKKAGQVPVYTYKVKAPTKGELGQKSSTILPRKLFTDHYQSHIVTEEFAKAGMHSFLNYYEREFSRRSSLFLFITDSSLSEIMMTNTPLAQLPGRMLRTLITNTNETTGRISKKSRIKDLVENLDSSTFTVLPIISLRGSKPAVTSDRFDNTDASDGSLILSGAAIFKKDKMIGKIKLKENGYYNLLKGEAESFFEAVTVNGAFIDLHANKIHTKQKLTLVDGVPVWKVEISFSLDIRNNEQTNKLDWSNLTQVTDQFNETIAEKTQAAYKKAIDEKWDLFGLGDKIKYKRGKAWSQLQKQKDAWTLTQLKVTVKSTIVDVGEIIDPYKGGE